MRDIMEKIGLPAVLEQLGEEGGEVVQASLKYARLLRGENPTPKTEEQCIDDLTEEIADVWLCINILIQCGVIDEYRMMRIMYSKRVRWKRRIADHK